MAALGLDLHPVMVLGHEWLRWPLCDLDDENYSASTRAFGLPSPRDREIQGALVAED